MSSDAIQIPTSQLVESVGYNQAPPPNGRDEIAHVLFLDVVGFTKLRPTKQRSVLEKLQQIVRETEDFCAARKQEQLIALPTGDGMALVFLTTVEGSGPATSCAEKIADALLKYNQNTNDKDTKINVRMGIHSGNVVRVSDVNDRPNVAGEGINTAQRVMDCGDVGHILLSNHSYHLLPADPDRTERCSHLGRVRVKHDQEVRLYSLVHDGIGNQEIPNKLRWQTEESARFEKIKAEFQKREKMRRILWASAFALIIIIGVGFLWITQKPPTEPSLAVLPFTPVTQTNSSKAISKGLTEQFIRSFGYLTDIQPQSLNTVKDVLNQNFSSNDPLSRVQSALEAGKRLKVRYVLTGTVESYNNDANLDNLRDVNSNFAVDVLAELYDTEAGKLVWNENYASKPFNQLTALHKTIIKEVTAKVGVTMRENVGIEKFATKESDAHWYYMLGRFWSTERTKATDQKQSEEITNKAIWNYDRAIEIDRNFALAHAGLVDVYTSIGGSNIDPIRAKEKAVKEAEDAQNCGDCPAEVYGSIGTEKWWLERNFSTARIAFQLAIKLNPHLADSYKRYSSCLAAQGKGDEAEKQIQRALAMEPDSTIFQLTSAQNYFFAKKYEQSIKTLEKLISIDPKPAAYRFLALAYQQKNMNKEALEQLEKGDRGRDDDSDFLSTRGHIFAQMGQTDEALKRAVRLEKLKVENKSYVSPYNISVIYAGLLGQEEKSFKWLDQAILEFDPRVTWLKVDPRFAELHELKGSEFDKRLQAAGLLP